MIYKPQKDFPHIDRYKKVFDVNEYTIFAYDKVIYCDFELPEHLQIHERRHLIRQDKIGADIWVDKYLADEQFRLQEEILAYKEQIESIKKRDARHRLRVKCAKDLASGLYGGIITEQKALQLLQQ